MSNQTVSVLRTRDDRVIPVAGVYEIDGAHTSVEFVGRHLMITKVRGRFRDVRGRITIAEEPENYRVTVTGTSGVVADCELPRDAVEAATRRWGSARARLAATLKRCADDVDARIPDGRG